MAAVGVICGMVPYFAAAGIIALLLEETAELQAYIPWLAAALAGYLARTLLYNGALSLSHKATFSILKTIRQKLLAKLPRLPLGTLVGPSSSGKSTLAKLIAGFWDVKSGSITMGGTDVRDYTLESLMNQISMVIQNVYLFVADTVENNIRFGCSAATREQVKAAAKKACCDDFIEALTHEKTVSMIAHRLKTVRSADQILVLDGGRLVQQGTHAELAPRTAFTRTSLLSGIRPPDGKFKPYGIRQGDDGRNRHRPAAVCEKYIS